MDLIQRFIEYLKVERNYSLNTLYAYENDLSDFKDFISKNVGQSKIEKVDYKIVRSWIIDLSNNQISNRSINRKISSLKTFYKFLVKTETIDISPLQGHKPLKQSNKIQVPFSKEEINLLFDQDLFAKDYKGVLQKTIISFFYFTGVRRIELINLKSANFNLDSSIIKVMGKRNKERIIPVLPKLKEFLTMYIDLKSKLSCLNKDDYLFISKSGNKLNEKFVYRTVNEYFKLVSPKIKRAPHVLRHSFATHLINEGADINSVKELLGHSSLSSTQVYSHTSMERIKEVFKKSHPRA
tara:strand:+ start:12472 stop:13359 length:888 start_codon:yes stop_codon:yes gene_type:complete